jgi:hypothetical protein
MESIEKAIIEKVEEMREEIIYFHAFSLFN